LECVFKPNAQDTQGDLENRRRLRADYGEFLVSTPGLLFRRETIGINFEVNTDEYLAEAVKTASLQQLLDQGV
jgi:hypothetical protein